MLPEKAKSMPFAADRLRDNYHNTSSTSNGLSFETFVSILVIIGAEIWIFFSSYWYLPLNSLVYCRKKTSANCLYHSNQCTNMKKISWGIKIVHQIFFHDIFVYGVPGPSVRWSPWWGPCQHTGWSAWSPRVLLCCWTFPAARHPPASWQPRQTVWKGWNYLTITPKSDTVHNHMADERKGCKISVLVL